MHHAILPIATHIFFHQDGKVLLLKRANTGWQDGTWSVPAGRVDEHEPIRAATVREAQEEVGAIIRPAALGQPLIMHHHDERGEQLYAFFLCAEWTGELSNREPDKCSEIAWFTPAAFPETLFPHVRQAWEELHQGLRYSEYGFPTQLR